MASYHFNPPTMFVVSVGRSGSCGSAKVDAARINAEVDGKSFMLKIHAYHISNLLRWLFDDFWISLQRFLFQACTFRGFAGMVFIESLNRKWDETKKAILALTWVSHKFLFVLCALVFLVAGRTRYGKSRCIQRRTKAWIKL